jgi:hypothetical protein
LKPVGSAVGSAVGAAELLAAQRDYRTLDRRG